ncbi:hypothetical protein GIB67_039359 [Kingdonia uniflora]|uniref:Helitron helicase-like domain-containing protein n=1 Tax=Kingdonia uniflora TaxID=39325 RepID=A0A7J7LXA0_9MAGN|nr:hypothetical protein GIB67_039359 [Kingdonia uniflora]
MREAAKESYNSSPAIQPKSYKPVHHDVEVVYYNPIESDDERNIDDEDNDNVNEVDEDNINGNDEGVQLGCHFLGQMDVLTHFSNLGVHMDNRVAHGRGPTSFVIHGELHHRIGALVPNEKQEASYAQLCIYNPSASLNTRHKRNPHLNKDVSKVIQDILVRYNPFSEFYRHTYEVLEDAAGDNENFNVPAYLHYRVSTDHRRYNLPSTDEIAVILPEDGSEISGVKDIIVYRKANQGLMQISECHPVYLPMHYVLIFPIGQLGWSVYLKHWNVAANAWYSTKKLSQWEYYCYHLFQRTTEYSPIL